MRVKQYGMILLTTLLCLGLLAAMLFSMQRAMWLFTALHQKTQQHHAELQALEATAMHVLKQPNTEKKCRSNQVDVQYAMLQLQQTLGCEVSLAGAQYRYWLNQLGYRDKQVVLAVQAVSNSELILSVRYSSTQGIMTRWYIYPSDFKMRDRECFKP
jgi:hypothetical protein